MLDMNMKTSGKLIDTNAINMFLDRIKTEEARKGIQLADELSDMILFHSRIYKNGKKMEQPWEDN